MAASSAATSNASGASSITLPGDDEIFGVKIKSLKSFPDQRGFFREVVRVSDPFFQIHTSMSGEPTSAERSAAFAQWSHSKMTKDVVKAWHYHHIQFDWWYIALGQIQTVLYDNREESPTYRKKLVFKMGDSSCSPDTFEACVRIPPGVLHGLKVLSDTAHLFYITSQTYNPNEEGRFPYNASFVGHDWGAEAITVENDRRTFVPTSTRALVR